ncbi:MAG: hypothetical protein R3B84_11300 [Zavarzinella sp.]
MELLTDAQKLTWKEMTGEKFEMQQGFGFGGGTRPGGNRPPRKDD